MARVLGRAARVYVGRGMSPTGIGRRLPRAPGMLGAFWVRMEACWTAKLLMCAQNVRQRRPFLFVSRGFENEGSPLANVYCQGCVNPPMTWKSPGGTGTAAARARASSSGMSPTPSAPAAARRRPRPGAPRAPSRTTRGSWEGAWWARRLAAAETRRTARSCWRRSLRLPRRY